MRELVSNLFTAATARGRLLWGILLNEVGNLSNLLNTVARQKFDAMLTEAFQDSCGETPQMHWSPGEHGRASSRCGSGVLSQLGSHGKG